MKKFIILFINIIATIFMISVLSIIFIKFKDDDVFDILNRPVYEESSNFYNIVNTRLLEIFQYVSYKIPFEVNNKFEESKIIAESLDPNGTIKQWTIGECIENAVNHGYYIDPSYSINEFNKNKTLPFPKTSYNFMLKTYPTTNNIGNQSEEAFIMEVLSTVANYRKCQNDLSPKTSNFKYRLTYFLDNKEIIYDNTNSPNNELYNNSAFIYISSKDDIINTNINNIDLNIMNIAKSIIAYKNYDYTLYCSVDTTYPLNDLLKTDSLKYNQIKNECGKLMTSFITSVFIFILTLFISIYFIFSTKKQLDPPKSIIQSMPTEFFIFMYIIIMACLFIIYKRFLCKRFPLLYDSFFMRLTHICTIIYVSTITFIATLSEKYATDSLPLTTFNVIQRYKNTVIPFMPTSFLFLFIFIPILLFIIIGVYLIYVYTKNGIKNILIVGLLVLASTIIFISYLLFIYEAFNNTLKSEKKSNEMRTALVTNVSHDIKTPLTSIINYTGLISMEINKPRTTKKSTANILHYSQILTDKANRLNDLINDLIFDSKASTGNIELQMENIDLKPFITDIINEFEDKFTHNNLKVIFETTLNEAYIYVDAKQLYRVFQNLFSNIDKYALENSRVYIDLKANKSKIQIIIKNIAKEKLEIDINTIKDRFTRGNVSRTTEGFGLGLSIADNLIKSMNGKLDIHNVRDTFITTITFISINTKKRTTTPPHPQQHVKNNYD